MGVPAIASEFSNRLTRESESSAFRYRKAALHAVVFAAAFALLFSRRPDAILHAQFWAEDGKYWYADAYHFGWRCLLMPLDGYLNTLSRLVGLLALLVPFSVAPLVMSVCALVVEVLPVHVLLSSRFASIPVPMRLAGSLLYLALPNSYETHAILTNLQWRLALVGCLVLLGTVQERTTQRIFEVTVLAGLTMAGPLGILLIPIAALARWLKRDGRRNLHLYALIPGGVLQFLLIIFSNSRPHPPNGASVSRLAGVVGGQIFASMTLGMKTILLMYLVGNRQHLYWIELTACGIGLCIVVYGLWFGPLELKLAICFASLVFGVALWNPLVIPESSTPQWELLQFPGLGNRYYFFPMLAFLTCLLWMLRASPSVLRTRVARYVAMAILATLPIGVCSDWVLPRFKDFHFREFAEAFERAPSGSKTVIPLNPTGWRMELTKK